MTLHRGNVNDGLGALQMGYIFDEFGPRRLTPWLPWAYRMNAQRDEMSQVSLQTLTSLLFE